MTFKERKERMEYLLYLIEKNRLSSTRKMAEKFGCSKRTVERMLNNLREEGYNIKFSKITGKYFIEK